MEAARLAAFFRRLWPAGATARLHLTALPTFGTSLLSLETRRSEEAWVRRVQLQIDPELLPPLIDELGVDMLLDEVYRPELDSSHPRAVAGELPRH